MVTPKGGSMNLRKLIDSEASRWEKKGVGTVPVPTNPKGKPSAGEIPRVDPPKKQDDEVK